MPLTRMDDIVGPAASRGRGVGAFNVVELEHAEAIVAGSAQAGAPVILQISENGVAYHGSLEPLALATFAIARRATFPVAVHLDHAESEELVKEAVAQGFSSVMFDASKLPYEENVERTCEMVRFCHGAGVWIEAELGQVGGKGGVHAPGVRTDPAAAAAYVEATDVDALAVAVGSSHAMLTRDAALDFGLITRLREMVPVPLVLHGSSGVSDDDLRQAVQAGMTKINISTQLNKSFTAAVRVFLQQNRTIVDPRGYLGAGRDAVAAETARLQGILTA